MRTMKEKGKKSVCLIKTDLMKFELKHEDTLSKIATDLYLLDILRMMSIFKKSGNMYYYRIFRKFIDAVRYELKLSKIDFERKLPRIYLKEKEIWELREMFSDKQ